MTTTAAVATCPACGAKIARPELSLCSYCATPLGLDKDAEREPTKTMQRLAHMEEHKDYALAQAWDPPEELEDPRIRPLRATASVLFLTGSLLALAAGLRWVLPGGSDSVLAPLLAVFAVALILLSLFRRWSAQRILSAAREFPLLKRPCLVQARGSLIGDLDPSATTYMFDLEFGDGSQGDFGYPGRGASHDPMTKGSTGIAYTRRERLLAFKQIRV
jgi:hypothetical protein